MGIDTMKYYIVMKESLLHAITRTNFINIKQNKPNTKESLI